MKTLTILFFLVILLFNSKTSWSQQNKDSVSLKNRLDCVLFGNRGFLNLVYNRIIFENNTVSVLPNVGVGIIPGSHDQDTIPGYLNFSIGLSIDGGWKYNKLVLGICYSLQKQYGGDKLNSTIDKYTNGLLGEMGYARSFKNSDFSFKVSYTPILIGNGYRKIENTPFGIFLCSRL